MCCRVSHFQGFFKASDGTFPSHHYFLNVFYFHDFCKKFPDRFLQEWVATACMCVYVYTYIIYVVIDTRIVKTNIFTDNQEGASSPQQGALWGCWNSPHALFCHGTMTTYHQHRSTSFPRGLRLTYFFTLHHHGQSRCAGCGELMCSYLMQADQMPTLASGTPWPLSWAPVGEGRQEGWQWWLQLNNFSACLEGEKT